MENASKALLIAGGVLIAILVMTLGIYFSRMIADHSARVYAQLEESRRTEFNQKFLNYDINHRKEDGSSNIDLTIQDVVTIANLAQSSNISNELMKIKPDGTIEAIRPQGFNSNWDSSNWSNINSYYVAVKCLGTYIEGKNENELNNGMTNEMNGTILNYSCKVYINNNTGYVNYIEIGY